MTVSRRRLLTGALASVPLALSASLKPSRAEAQATTLKISHQFPAASGADAAADTSDTDPAALAQDASDEGPQTSDASESADAPAPDGDADGGSVGGDESA